MKISLGNPTKQMLRGMEQRVIAFTKEIKKAANGKFTRNTEICGFLLIAPRAKSTITTVTFNGIEVATIGDGEMTVNDYDVRIFGAENLFKYDIIVGIADEINGIEEDVIVDSNDDNKKDIIAEEEKDAIDPEPAEDDTDTDKKTITKEDVSDELNKILKEVAVREGVKEGIGVGKVTPKLPAKKPKRRSKK